MVRPLWYDSLIGRKGVRKMSVNPFGGSGSVVRVPSKVSASSRRLGSPGARLSNTGSGRAVRRSDSMARHPAGRALTAEDNNNLAAVIAMADFVRGVNRAEIAANLALDSRKESRKAISERLDSVGDWDS